MGCGVLFSSFEYKGTLLFSKTKSPACVNLQIMEASLDFVYF